MKLKNTYVMIICGLIIVLVGIWHTVVPKQIDKECTEKVTAVITDITSTKKRTQDYYLHEWHSKRTTDHSVKISFDYNGKTYNGIYLDYYKASMNEGDEVTVYINPHEPWHISTGESSTNPIIYIFLGIFVIALGLIKEIKHMD